MWIKTINHNKFSAFDEFADEFLSIKQLEGWMICYDVMLSCQKLFFFFIGMKKNSVCSQKLSQSPFDKNIDCYGIVLYSILEGKKYRQIKIVLI